MKIKESEIEHAAHTLIGLVRLVERDEKQRASKSTLSLEIELTGGGIETWEITIERTASSH